MTAGLATQLQLLAIATEMVVSVSGGRSTSCLALKEVVVSLINYEEVHGTGTLILPQWLITARSCAKHDSIARYTISAKFENNSVYTSNMQAIYTIIADRQESKIPPVHLVKLQRPVSECSPLAAVATRVDAFFETPCTIYASLPNLMVVSLRAWMETEDRCHHLSSGYPRGAMICARTVNSCYLPCGSPLICYGRLLGVRDDTLECTGKFVAFLSIAFQDHAILSELSYWKQGFVTAVWKGGGENAITASTYSSSRKARVVNVGLVLCVTFLTFLDVLNASK
ncbi:hypothetical protein Trydic_g2760 [Trypoxylus dichotomus]